MTAQQVGRDVVFTYTGSIDLAGLGTGAASQIRGLVYPVNAYVEFGPGTAVLNGADSYSSAVVTATAPANIGGGGVNFASTFSGSYFSVHRNSIKLPLAYVSGNAISGTMRFNSATFATMGLVSSETPYLWTLTNGQKITLSFLAPIAGQPSNAALKKALLQTLGKIQKQVQDARREHDAAAVRRFTAKIKALRKKIRKL